MIKTRFPTRAEVEELIEAWFNHDASSAYMGKGIYEFTLIGVDHDQVRQDVLDFAIDRDVPLDEDAVQIKPDVIEDPHFECITVTIQTGDPA